MRPIPDVDSTLRAQDHLEELCADRPLATAEHFTPNDFYGGATVLKSYVGWDWERPLKAILPHGPTHDALHVWRPEIEAPVPGVLCFPRHREHLYRHLTSKLVIPAASPYLYALEMMSGLLPRERRGTIYFPSHSTHHYSSDVRFDRLADSLQHLSEECLPVTICMYWRDIELGHHVHFRDRGFRIVSAGHIYDPEFLYRFHHLCSMHRFASGNSIGTHVHYAVKSGCTFFLFDPQGISRNEVEDPFGPIGEKNVEVMEARIDRPPTISAVFRDRLEATSPDQMAVVDYYLGTEHLRSREDLADELKRLEHSDRFGYRPHRDGAPSFMIPPFLVRRRQRMHYRLCEVRSTIRAKRSAFEPTRSPG